MMEPLLTIDQVTRRFGGNVAVSGVSFSVMKGDITGLIGPNGAGKTTLFNCMTGYISLDAGTIIFEGRRINGKRPDQMCRLGMVRTWQRVKPLGKLSVLENVMIGAFVTTASPKVAGKASLEQLQAVGLDRYADQPAGTLPIGLKKKLELARVMATRPKMVLLDEICGGLNHAETESVLDIVRMLRKRGVTILFIEHDMKAVTSICDRIVVLSSGEKLAEGTPEEITSHPAVIEAYLGGGYHAQG
ncbi:MAG: ABC transporter ATP-binding protein [Chlorobiaceae bacterium]|nr:ABC transporter ATP-binding protein [Chlorobiaceae bacterium]